ncbi:hypothetical protein HLH33_06095 [Gluconacetobacter diazotrophicus]|uniref:N-acetyltransferase domain-containing protein n=1 Tax=Gluconacetobacter diazotrophicus TaxID=33996 RepID=A0A7W4I5G0_GLUDI|nr:hypothetical protein [Gluconacetobacter diazotrophicus]MBB2155885.1 hypothetical protein [Gluconacetobacter diazotrophicus]
MNEADQLVITPVSSFRQMSLFIRLPRLLYAGLPGYVPPLDMEQKDLLHPRKTAFFRHGRARYFLAMRAGKPVGRISAQVDDLAIETLGENIGFFGALDAVDDASVVSALLDAACAWLRRQGMDTARGPFTLNANGELGMMIEGHRAPPMIAMPWHPHWLPPLVEACGFAKAMDFVAYQMETGPGAEQAHLVPSGLRLGEGRLGSITTRGIRRRQIAEDGEILRRLYNDAWRNNWGFVPLTQDEMTGMIRQMRPILKSEHFVLIEQDGEPVAVALVVPNLYDIAGDLDGAPTPLGWVKLAERLVRHRFHSARVILLGVSSKLEGTALGAIMPALAIAELMRRGRSLPYRMVEMGWILETNLPMRRLIERLAPEPCKRYRVYDRVLGR